MSTEASDCLEYTNVEGGTSGLTMYQPGSNSASFLEVPLQTSLLKFSSSLSRGSIAAVLFLTDAFRTIPLVTKMALLLTDAFEQLHGRLPWDGAVYVTSPGSHLVDSSAEDLAQAGPHLVFIHFVWSELDRQRWRSASLERRIELCSITCHETQDLESVLPARCRLDISPFVLALKLVSSTLSDQELDLPVERQTVFPRLPASDLVSRRPGLIIDFISQRSLCAPLREYLDGCLMKNEAEPPSGACAVVPLKDPTTGALTVEGEWVQQHLLEAEDQTQALVQMISGYIKENWDAAMPYGELHKFAMKLAKEWEHAGGRYNEASDREQDEE